MFDLVLRVSSWIAGRPILSGFLFTPVALLLVLIYLRELADESSIDKITRLPKKCFVGLALVSKVQRTPSR